MSVGPRWCDADAMPAAFLATPRKLHKEIAIRGQKAFVANAGTGGKPSPVDPVLDVPDVPQLFPSFWGIMDGCRW